MAISCVYQCGKCFNKFRIGTNFISLINVRVAHKYAQADVKPNKYKVIYRDLHGAIEEPSTAKDFVFALSKNERQLLYFELQKFHLDMEDFKVTHSPPSADQLKKVALHNALPFIGFGFLDNFLMILALNLWLKSIEMPTSPYDVPSSLLFNVDRFSSKATKCHFDIVTGEYIEFKFGAMFGISTMAAAALGNWISDLAGVQTAHYVEVVTSKFGVKAPALSPEQVDMSSTRWASNIGKAIGVSIGCVLGMFPLLFYKPKNKQKEEEAPS